MAASRTPLVLRGAVDIPTWFSIILAIPAPYTEIEAAGGGLDMTRLFGHSDAGFGAGAGAGVGAGAGAGAGLAQASGKLSPTTNSTDITINTHRLKLTLPPP